eukprot:scaffold246720_cov27-Tisochrysis_lutea.AAC.1
MGLASSVTSGRLRGVLVPPGAAGGFSYSLGTTSGWKPTGANCRVEREADADVNVNLEANSEAWLRHSQFEV